MREAVQDKWVIGPLNPMFTVKELHVWRISLPIPEEIKMFFQKNLSTDEWVRVNRFHFNKDKERFIVARGGLRVVLARYLNDIPLNILFHYTEFGKPYLNSSQLHFNLSHSANCILYAISRDIEVGIDVEYLRDDIDYLSIAEQFCSENEYKKLLEVPIEERSLAFYRCWTRKEAILKAIGKGLSFPINQVEVNFLPSEVPRLLKTLDPHPAECHLEEINPGEGYIATLAALQKYTRVNLWDWQDL